MFRVEYLITPALPSQHLLQGIRCLALDFMQTVERNHGQGRVRMALVVLPGQRLQGVAREESITRQFG